MALTRTTLSAAVALNDTSLRVASGTGFAKGKFIRIDDEMLQQSADAEAATLTIIPVVRGQDGTIHRAHVITAGVEVGSGADFANPAAAQVVSYPLGGRRRSVSSITATGAVPLPEPGTDSVVVLNGTSVIAATIAVPTADMDGCFLTIVSNGAAAHTLTFAGGLSGASTSYDVLTVNATAPTASMFVACNQLWLALAQIPISGTVTNVTNALA